MRKSTLATHQSFSSIEDKLIGHIRVLDADILIFCFVCIVVVSTANALHFPQFKELIASVLVFGSESHLPVFWVRAFLNVFVYVVFVSTAYISAYRSILYTLEFAGYSRESRRKVRVLTPFIGASIAIIIPISLTLSFDEVYELQRKALKSPETLDVVWRIFYISQLLALMSVLTLIVAELRGASINKIYSYSYILGFFLFFGAISLEWLGPVYWAQWVGPIAVILIFVNFIVCSTRLFTAQGNRYTDLMFGTVCLLVVFLTFMLTAGTYNNLLGTLWRQDAKTAELPNLNNLIMGTSPDVDKDTLRLPVASEGTPFLDAFGRWLGHRRLPGPVIIVSAQGGGIFTAYYTANLLAAFQDRCAAFKDHVFGISGVSGGSVGAAIFTAMARRNNSEKLAPSLHEFFGHDFLTPVIASYLFRDLPGNFVRLGGQDNRGDTLRESLSAAWQDIFPNENSILSMAMTEYWLPEQSVPALFLNATMANNGWPVVMSPFNLQEIADFENQDAGNLPAHGTLLAAPFWDYTGWGWPRVSVGQAAVTSASFPLITPATRLDGFHRLRDDINVISVKPTNVKLTDGGFFDNSGSYTAAKLVAGIRSRYPETRIVLLRLSVHLRQETLSPAPPDVLLPLTTLSSVRTFHQRTISDEVARELQQANSSLGKSNVQIVSARLALEKDFILSWQLSPATQQTIDDGISRFLGSQDAEAIMQDLGCGTSR